MTLDAWLAARTRNAPAVLRERVLEHAAPAPAGLMPAQHLAAAAQRVLEEVERHPGDRTVALDLLAADALITLALLARAEAAPGELAAFAGALLQTGPAPA